jgi:hypothetical protein
MQFIPALFNMAIILLFVRLCAPPDRETFFNPFVVFTTSRIDRATALLKPMLALPEKAVLVLLLIFVFLFKSLLISRIGLQPGVDFGEAFRCLPPAAGMRQHAPLLFFSLLETVSFTLKFWCFHFFAGLIAAPSGFTRASQALNYYARPFSAMPLLFRPFFLIGCHMVLAFIAVNAGVLATNALQPGAAFTDTAAIAASPFPVSVIKTASLGALAFFEGISVMISALFAFIIGSLLAALLQKPGMMTLCREGSDLVLGRFSRGRATQAGLDFTPLIFFIVANLAYNAINVVIFTFVNLQIAVP